MKKLEFDKNGKFRKRFFLGDEESMKDWLHGSGINLEEAKKYAEEVQDYLGWELHFPAKEVSYPDNNSFYKPISDAELKKSEEDYEKVRDWYRDRSKDFDSWW